MAWMILNRAGETFSEEIPPPRPPDARPMEDGDPLTPWYETDGHLHVKNGRIVAIHARGPVEDLRALMWDCLRYEEAILAQFDGAADIPVTPAKLVIEHAIDKKLASYS